MLAAAEFRTKETSGRAWSGTPWSGHAVKWYWYTVLSAEAAAAWADTRLFFLLLATRIGRMLNVLKVYEARMSSRRRLTTRSPYVSEPASGQYKSHLGWKK